MHFKSNNFSIDLNGFQALILIALLLIVILLIVAMIVRRKNAKKSEQGSNNNLKLNKEQVAKLDILIEQNKQIKKDLDNIMNEIRKNQGNLEKQEKTKEEASK